MEKSEFHKYIHNKIAISLSESCGIPKIIVEKSIDEPMIDGVIDVYLENLYNKLKDKCKYYQNKVNKNKIPRGVPKKIRENILSMMEERGMVKVTRKEVIFK